MNRGKGNYRPFTDAEKALMERLRGEGRTSREIANAIGEDNPKRVSDWLKPSRIRSRKELQQERTRIPSTAPSLEWRQSSIPWPTKAQLMARR